MPTKKARVEAAQADPVKKADPVPGDNGKALQRILDYFKAEHPSKWEEIALGPTQHGIDAMIFILSGGE